jgi:hypothetical protein
LATLPATLPCELHEFLANFARWTWLRIKERTSNPANGLISIGSAEYENNSNIRLYARCGGHSPRIEWRCSSSGQGASGVGVRQIALRRKNQLSPQDEMSS